MFNYKKFFFIVYAYRIIDIIVIKLRNWFYSKHLHIIMIYYDKTYFNN